MPKKDFSDLADAVPESVFGKRNPNRRRRNSHKVKKVFKGLTLVHSAPEPVIAIPEPAPKAAAPAPVLKQVSAPAKPVKAPVAASTHIEPMPSPKKKTSPKMLWPPQVEGDGWHAGHMPHKQKAEPPPPVVKARAERAKAKASSESPHAAPSGTLLKRVMLNDFGGKLVSLRLPQQLAQHTRDDGATCRLGSFVEEEGELCGHFFFLPSGVKAGEKIVARVSAMRAKPVEGPAQLYFHVHRVQQHGNMEPELELVVHRNVEKVEERKGSFLAWDTAHKSAVEVRRKTEPKA